MQEIDINIKQTVYENIEDQRACISACIQPWFRKRSFVQNSYPMLFLKRYGPYIFR